MPDELFAAVVAALRWAWPLLRAETTIDPMTNEEEAISFEISRLLNQRIDGKRRASMLRLFETVQREAQHEGANKFRNKPDLTFRPKGMPHGVTNQDDWGVFVECKIIEGRRHDPRSYCNQGLQKFADGRYAGRMSTGLMVAYGRDGRTPRSTLHRLLKKQKALSTTRLRACGRIRDMARSTHDRSQLASPCVSVDVTHLWLDGRPHGLRGRPKPKP